MTDIHPAHERAPHIAGSKILANARHFAFFIGDQYDKHITQLQNHTYIFLV